MSRSFEDLVDEAAAANVSGWDFSWLDGRASEERPPWGYARLLGERLAGASSALDLDTGGGEVLAAMPSLPARMSVTENWPPNAERARALLGPRGVAVVQTPGGGGLPFADASFELVSSRHPVAVDWPEIARVLKPGGRYFAQHVGPASAFELIEYFLGPLPVQRRSRDPRDAVQAATAAGLDVVDLRSVRCRMEFFDIGAVVYILRKCVWWVPGFTVEKYEEQLRHLDRQIRSDGAFVAHSSRFLIEAVRR